MQVVFPNHCVYCQKIIGQEGLFCVDCWPKLQFISEPKCSICSFPFTIEINSHLSGKLVCANCIAKKPFYDKSIVIFRYNYLIRKIVSDLKYRDQTFLAKKVSEILFNKAKNQIIDADLIVAVPMHLKRLRQRKFNQSVMICRNLKFKQKRLKFFPDLLLRVKDTAPQVQLRKKQREKNLKKVFLLNKKYQSLVLNKKILLVDDVMTTGATLNNCAKELKRKGAKEIIVLTIAKTIFNIS